jgi:hypothetical protein
MLGVTMQLIIKPLVVPRHYSGVAWRGVCHQMLRVACLPQLRQRRSELLEIVQCILAKIPLVVSGAQAHHCYSVATASVRFL